jgi:hypothetical protein
MGTWKRLPLAIVIIRPSLRLNPNHHPFYGFAFCYLELYPAIARPTNNSIWEYALIGHDALS